MKAYMQRISVLFLCLVLLFGGVVTPALASAAQAPEGISAYAEKELVIDALTETPLLAAAREGGEYRLRAARYSYDSEGAAASVLWVPTALILPSGERVAFAPLLDEYTAAFSCDDEPLAFCVVYTASFVIANGATPYDTLMRAYASARNGEEALALSQARYEEALLEGEEASELAYAYQKAQLSYASELATYKAAKRAYDAAYDGYRAYTAYESAKTKYDNYLSELALYEAELSLYNDYLKALADYETACSNYEKQVAAYDEMKYHLSLIGLAKTKMTDLNRTLHAAITGSVVQDEVLGNETLIVEVLKVPKEIVDLAGDSTKTLIMLFDGVENKVKVGSGYFDLKTEQERYAFYVANHESLAAAYLELFQALERLYRFQLVCDAISIKGKLQEYVILLAQLHLVANLLNDEPIANYEGTAFFDDSWTVKMKENNKFVYKTARDILGEEYTKYAIDKNAAAPLASGYPGVPGKEPTAPDVVADPGNPPPFVAEPEKVPVVNYPGGEFVEPPLAENVFDLTDRAPGQTDISSALADASGDALTLHYVSASLYFSEEAVGEMKSLGVVSVAPSVTDDAYSCVFLDENGGEVVLENPIKVVFEVEEASHDKRLTYLENEEKCYQSFALYDNKLTFYAKTGVVYRLVDEYSLYIAPNELVTVSADKQLAEVGERVTLAAELIPGVRLERLIVTDAAGNAVALDEGDTFLMTEGGVRVLAVATYINYKVTFTVAGKTLLAETYTYGEMPKLPPPPIRSDEGRLRYTFSHWSPSVSAVTGDIEYDAVFSVELLPEADDGGIKISDGARRIILYGGIAAGVFLVLIAAGICALVCVRRKRRKQALTSDDGKGETENISEATENGLPPTMATELSEGIAEETELPEASACDEDAVPDESLDEEDTAP